MMYKLKITFLSHYYLDESILICGDTTLSSSIRNPFFRWSLGDIHYNYMCSYLKNNVHYNMKMLWWTDIWWWILFYFEQMANHCIKKNRKNNSPKGLQWREASIDWKTQQKPIQRNMLEKGGFMFQTMWSLILWAITGYRSQVLSNFCQIDFDCCKLQQVASYAFNWTARSKSRRAYQRNLWENSKGH